MVLDQLGGLEMYKLMNEMLEGEHQQWSTSEMPDRERTFNNHNGNNGYNKGMVDKDIIEEESNRGGARGEYTRLTGRALDSTGSLVDLRRRVLVCRWLYVMGFLQEDFPPRQRYVPHHQREEDRKYRV